VALAEFTPSSLLALALGRLFSSGPIDRSGNGKAPEEQVAMIAQKVVDAKQSQQPRGSLIALPDSAATALWTPFSKHSLFVYLQFVSR
jgi:hypothetical protein